MCCRLVIVLLLGVLSLFGVVVSQITLKDAWNEFHVEEEMANDEFYQFGMAMWGYNSESMSEFFFDGHDSDHNTKLDGLELLHSLLKVKVSFDRSEWIVDFILKEADQDRDGLLDYAEYLNSRKEIHQHKSV